MQHRWEIEGGLNKKWYVMGFSEITKFEVFCFGFQVDAANAKAS